MKRLAATLAGVLLPIAAIAQTNSVLATKRPVTWGMIFALLFLMLGPIRLLGIFAATTKDCDATFRLRLATRAFLFAIAAVTIAAALGKRMLDAARAVDVDNQHDGNRPNKQEQHRHHDLTAAHHPELAATKNSPRRAHQVQHPRPSLSLGLRPIGTVRLLTPQSVAS